MPNLCNKEAFLWWTYLVWCSNVHMCLYLVLMHAYGCTHGRQRLSSGNIHQYSLPYVWGNMSLSLHLRITNWCSRDHPGSASIDLNLEATADTPSFYIYILGIILMHLYFYNKHITNRGIYPVPEVENFWFKKVSLFILFYF